MNSILITVVFLASSWFYGAGQQEKKQVNSVGDAIVISDSFAIDIGVSKVIWSGKALGLIKHEGTVDFAQATLDIDHGKISGGVFIVDLTSITPTDKNLNPEEGPRADKLKQHLSSAEFFDVKTYPSATFSLESVETNSASGTLQIRDSRHTEKVENITITREGGRIIIKGDMTINRKVYDVSWDSSFKDSIMSEKIFLQVVLIGR